MIRFTYKEVNGADFQRAMQKLTNSVLANNTIAYRVARIAKLIQQQFKVISKTYEKEVLGPYLVKDAQGKPVLTDPKDPGSFKLIENEDTQKNLKADNEKFELTEFTIDKWKLKLDDLASVKFTAAELIALEPLLEEIPVEEKK